MTGVPGIDSNRPFISSIRRRSRDSSGARGITGSYNNHFVLWNIPDMAAGGAGGGTGEAAVQQITIEALKDGPKRKETATPTAALNGGSGGGLSGSGRKLKLGGKGGVKENGSSPSAAHGGARGGGAEAYNVQQMDFGKKALHVSWHPRLNAVAVAGLNKLYIYQAVQGGAAH